MSDDSLSENMRMRSVKYLEIDLINLLGEDPEYISQLEYDYVRMYLIKDRCPTSNELAEYRRQYMTHLLSIVKVKHPEHYTIFEDRYKTWDKGLDNFTTGMWWLVMKTINLYIMRTINNIYDKKIKHKGEKLHYVW